MTRHHTQAMRAITLNTHGGPKQLIPRQARWRPVVDSVYRVDDAAAAHARLEQPDRFGKVVLECRST